MNPTHNTSHPPASAEGPGSPQRRQLLLGGAGLAATAGLAGLAPRAWAQAAELPEYVGWKDAQALIMHSANTLETRHDAIGRGILTPSD